ncbi:MAG: GNAT family N-acetyltransferase [Pseudomonadota bacterium]
MTFGVKRVDPVASGTLVLSLARRVFEQVDAEDLHWRLAVMPDVSLFVAEREGRAIGFKAGYAATSRRYYSWLGGVDPDFRRLGVAAALMRAQHEWLARTRFQLVETHVRESNIAMIQANLDAGFSITGRFMKAGQPNLIMQRDIAS